MFRKVLAKIYRHLFNKEQIRIYNDLVKMQHYSDDEKHSYQMVKLRRILSTITHSVDYYKKYAIDVDHINYAEFQKLPVLTKEIVRNSNGALINQKFQHHDTIVKNTSGGSTGEPVEFYQTKYSQRCGVANFFFANYLSGVSPFDKTVDLWGALRDMNHTGDVDLRTELKHFLQNKTTFNTFVLDKNIMNKYIKALNNTKPHFIKAYVHSLYDIAKYINTNSIEITFSPIIHTTTGPLYPEMKKEIEKAFNTESVFSFYGSREVSAIATQIIGSEGMHVMFDNVFVEILDENDEPVEIGEEGEVVITTLNNFYMPLVRYRIGDRAVKGDNYFGTLHLKNVLGRTLGVIYKQDGGYIDGQYFTTLFFGKSGIKNFQIIQKNLESLQVNIVKNKNFKEADLNGVLYKIRAQLGDGINIQVDYCEKIDLTETGKIMYVYSEINR